MDDNINHILGPLSNGSTFDSKSTNSLIDNSPGLNCKFRNVGLNHESQSEGYHSAPKQSYIKKYASGIKSIRASSPIDHKLSFNDFKRKRMSEINNLNKFLNNGKKANLKEIMTIISSEWKLQKEYKHNQKKNLMEYNEYLPPPSKKFSTTSSLDNNFKSCKSVFKSGINSNSEMSEVSDEKEFYCAFCDKQCKSSYHFNAHCNGKDHGRIMQRLSHLSESKNTKDFKSAIQTLRPSLTSTSTTSSPRLLSPLSNCHFPSPKIQKCFVNNKQINPSLKRNFDALDESEIDKNMNLDNLASSISNFYKQKCFEVRQSNNQIYLLKSSHSYKQILKTKEALNDLTKLVRSFQSLQLKFRKMENFESSYKPPGAEYLENTNQTMNNLPVTFTNYNYYDYTFSNDNHI